MAAILVIAFSGSNDSGAVDSPHGSLAPLQTRELTATPRAASDTCPSARRAVKFYARRLTQWRAKMGVAQRQGRVALASRSVRIRGCPRYLAHVLQRKARAARHAYERWSHEWEWQRWLPAKYYRVARCETGVDWAFDSGTYVTAFGIIRVAAPGWNGHNSPRWQYEVARSIRSRYGWSAWGCGGA